MKKLLLVVVTLFCFSSSSFAYFNTLNLDHKTQNTDIWCWAAVTAMVGQQMTDGGQRIQDYDILTHVFKTDCKRYPSRCYTTGQLEEIQSMLRVFFYVDSYHTNGWASFADIEDMIDNGAPLIAVMRGKSGGGIGHVIVISGYNDNNPRNRKIKINDPMNRIAKWVNYEQFIYNYGRMLWAETIYITPEQRVSSSSSDSGYFDSLLN